MGVERALVYRGVRRCRGRLQSARSAHADVTRDVETSQCGAGLPRPARPRRGMNASMTYRFAFREPLDGRDRLSACGRCRGVATPAHIGLALRCDCPTIEPLLVLGRSL